MQNRVFIFLFLSLNFVLFEKSYAHSHYHVVVVEPTPVVVVQATPAEPAYVDVDSAPPADLAEQVEPCPSENYVWVGGYWKWDGRWVWRRGYWNLRPYSGAVWDAGHWSHHHGRWVYKEGHWR